MYSISSCNWPILLWLNLLIRDWNFNKNAYLLVCFITYTNMWKMKLRNIKQGFWIHWNSFFSINDSRIELKILEFDDYIKNNKVGESRQYNT